jgi:hypothetical protein
LAVAPKLNEFWLGERGARLLSESMTTVRVAAAVAARSGALAPCPYVRTEKTSIVPFRVGSASIFLDNVTKGDFTGCLGLVNEKPLAANRDGVRVFGGVTHGHCPHMVVQTKQDPGVWDGSAIGSR